MKRLMLLVAALTSGIAPLHAAYKGVGGSAVAYQLQRGTAGISLTFRSPRFTEHGQSVFTALAVGSAEGSAIAPYAKGSKGSTVFLPFRATLIVDAAADGSAVHVRAWEGTIWGPRRPAEGLATVSRSGDAVTLALPWKMLGGPSVRIAAWCRDFTKDADWGVFYGSLDATAPEGPGDAAVRRYLASDDQSTSLRTRGGTDLSKVRIYQMLPRHFGNTNETRRPNGTLEENGSGKFADLNARSLAELKKLGFTHVWPTGVLQQATATDYSAIGEPADDPDLLKGLAGSPYAIRDYFDVCPDYATDPAKRLDEFKAMVGRVHQAGLKVIIDFVPNHVARSHQSNIRPELSFGARDDRSKFFSPDNNFFWLTPEARPTGKGPPLRLPTVDASGNIVSPTSRVAKAKSDGLFEPESKDGRVTGNNLVSWEPDLGSWYETVKLNYGFDFTDPSKKTKAYPHGGKNDIPLPDTWKKMDEIIAYWQGLGVDGFRVDMAHMVPPEFWSWMTARARGRNPDVFFVAEAYDTDPAKVPAGDPLASAVGGNNVMFDLLNSGFDAVYDDATYDKLKEIYDGGSWANDLDALTTRAFLFDNSLRYAENHDEVRLAGKGQWGGIGMEVGRPVSALLFSLSRGPVMLYSGQEVGEPADGAEGFGGDDARTSIFDYWSMPEFTKWVNGGKFDGGRLSAEQKSLRGFYGRLVNLVNEPAFRDGAFHPLNRENVDNPKFARIQGEQASGHWAYAHLRRDAASGQAFLVLINLHKSETFSSVGIQLSSAALAFLGLDKAEPGSAVTFTESLSGGAPLKITRTAAQLRAEGFVCDKLPPLTPYFFRIESEAIR